MICSHSIASIAICWSHEQKKKALKRKGNVCHLMMWEVEGAGWSGMSDDVLSLPHHSSAWSILSYVVFTLRLRHSPVCRGMMCCMAWHHVCVWRKASYIQNNQNDKICSFLFSFLSSLVAGRPVCYRSGRSCLWYSNTNTSNESEHELGGIWNSVWRSYRTSSHTNLCSNVNERRTRETKKKHVIFLPASDKLLLWIPHVLRRKESVWETNLCKQLLNGDDATILGRQGYQLWRLCQLESNEWWFLV